MENGVFILNIGELNIRSNFQECSATMNGSQKYLLEFNHKNHSILSRFSFLYNQTEG